MKETEELIKMYKIHCTVKEFEDNKNNIQDKINWVFISTYFNLSESFIEKYKNKVDLLCIEKSKVLYKHHRFSIRG